MEPDLCVVNVDARADMDMRTQGKCFFKAFEVYKTTKKFCLVTSGLGYKFAGDANPVPAQWTGVPKLTSSSTSESTMVAGRPPATMRTW